MIDAHRYLTSEEAAAYLRLPSPRALSMFRTRYKVPVGIRRGRRLLFTREQLDAALAQFYEDGSGARKAKTPTIRVK